MITKQGRIPTLDYDLLIHVKSDNSTWITPQNPVELYGEEFRGYNWNDERITEKNITDRDDDGVESWPTPPEESTINDVARCIKPINPEFEVRWNGKEWTEADDGALCNAIFVKLDITNGKISISGVLSDPNSLTGFSPTNIVHAKMLYPDYAWVIYSEREDGFRILNPFNPKGNGLVPGADESYISIGNFVRSDGEIRNIEGTNSNTGPENEPPSDSVDKSPLIFESYLEFKSWYQSVDSTYMWKRGAGTNKTGRKLKNDYGRLIYVIEDNQLWMTPQNPKESRSLAGSGWGVWGTSIISEKSNVPREFKLIEMGFSISWEDSDFNWETGENNFNIPAYWKKIIWNGSKILIQEATESSPSNLNDAKNKFPHHCWVSTHEKSELLINPFNAQGTGKISGPDFFKFKHNYFLQANGKWSLIQEKIEFYISNLSSNIHEKLITKPSVFNYITVALENSSPDPIYFYIYKKQFNEITESWDSNLITQINLNPDEGVESYIQSIVFDSEEFSYGDIIRIECINNGNSLVHTGSINVVIQYEDYL